MSALFGFINLDGQAADPAVLARMQDALDGWGPDEQGAWVDGPTALGHRMLRITPESLHEHLPAHDPTSDLVLTADACLYNREELFAALDIPPQIRQETTDSTLILKAYEKWGSACPEHLIGDFAFALWNRREKTLFCARDHMGIRPFYYAHLPGRLFAFASDLKGLLPLPGLPRRLNEVAVADFLSTRVTDKEITLYEDIVRLPAAHTLTIQGGSLRRQCYWQLDPRRTVRLKSPEAYAEKLRALVEEAVTCRIRSAFPVAAHLSGGLDSSSLAILAARELRAEGKRLVTASFVPDQAEGWDFKDERPYVEAVCAQEEIDAHYLSPEKTWKVGEEVDTGATEPAMDDKAPQVRTGALFASKGARVILSGWGGDELPTFNGRGYYAELFLRGRWIKLFRASKARCRNYRLRMHSFFKHNILVYIMPDALQKLLFGRNMKQFPFDSFLNPAFAKRIEALQRGREGLYLISNARKNQHRLITSGHIQHRTEMWAPLEAFNPVNYRYPLLDVRVLAFCLSVPSEQYVYDGWARSLYRRAMEGVLPEEIRWRYGKLVPFPDSLRRRANMKQDMLDQLADLEKKPVMAQYLDLAKMRSALEALPDEEALKDNDALQTATMQRSGRVGSGFALAKLLENHGFC